MNAEQNKVVAHDLFARFTASDIQGVLDTMTSDATWWIPGKQDRSPSAGLYSKEKIARLFYAMLKQLKSGLTMTVRVASPKAAR